MFIITPRSVFSIAALFLAGVAAQGGGMAELKAITGDAPYSGVGNAPAPIPQPMGFWGRPRYSPVGFGGGAPYWGGYDGGYGGGMYGGGPDRFTSVGHSPYGELGPLRSSGYSPDLFSAMMSFFDGASSPFSSHPSPRRFNPSVISSPAVHSAPSVVHNAPSPSSSSSSGDFSLSSLGGGGGGGLGGFYKGNGN